MEATESLRNLALKNNIFLFVPSHKNSAKLISPTPITLIFLSATCIRCCFPFPLMTHPPPVQQHISHQMSDSNLDHLTCHSAVHTPNIQASTISCSIFSIGKTKQQMNNNTHCHFILKTLLCCDSYRKKSLTDWIIYILRSLPHQLNNIISFHSFVYLIKSYHLSCLSIAKSIEPPSTSVLHLCKINNTEIQRNPGS